MNETHVHRFIFGRQQDGWSHGVCACGEEQSCLNPDFDDAGFNNDRGKGRRKMAKVQQAMMMRPSFAAEMEGDIARAKLRCGNGHEYTDATRYIRPSTGKVSCRICAAHRQMKARSGTMQDV